jgi:hypothetical protein
MRKRLPPRTLDALTPPGGARFPYAFFENVHQHPLQSNQGGFDARTAWFLADAAFLAYSSDPAIAAQYRRPELAATVEPFTGTRGTQCYVAAAPDWIVLAFRGTQLDNFWQHVLDVRTDLRALPVRDSAGDLVHDGFLRGVDEVWLRLRRYIADQQQQRRRPLWITGHSLGAGLATIAANRCSTDPALGAVGLYTYASPPVGDAQFSRRISIPAFRVANNTDVLTKLPYAVYAPVGELRFIDANGQLRREAPSVADRVVGFAESVSTGVMMAASRLRLARLGIPLPGFIADHAPINYATLLWNSYIERPPA